MDNANNAADRTITCPHCKAFNGRSRCGCAAARAERGELPASTLTVDDIELELPARKPFKGATIEW